MAPHAVASSCAGVELNLHIGPAQRIPDRRTHAPMAIGKPESPGRQTAARFNSPGGISSPSLSRPLSVNQNSPVTGMPGKARLNCERRARRFHAMNHPGSCAESRINQVHLQILHGAPSETYNLSSGPNPMYFHECSLPLSGNAWIDDFRRPRDYQAAFSIPGKRRIFSISATYKSPSRNATPFGILNFFAIVTTSGEPENAFLTA